MEDNFLMEDNLKMEEDLPIEHVLKIENNLQSLRQCSNGNFKEKTKVGCGSAQLNLLLLFNQGSFFHIR